jgi:hypothetical protein
LAQGYEAAVTMAFDDTFPGRVWFIAHALRDIRNRLPEALDGGTRGPRTEYSHLAKKITTCWIEDGLPVDGRYSVTEAYSRPQQAHRVT